MYSWIYSEPKIGLPTHEILAFLCTYALVLRHLNRPSSIPTGNPIDFYYTFCE